MMKLMLPVLALAAIAGVASAQPTTTPPNPPTPPRAPRAEVQIERVFGGGTYLGVIPRDVTADKAHSLGMTEPTGVLLDDVVADGPAKGAGLQKNDVIVTWNGTRVESAAQLRRLIHETPADRTVRIGYMRAGATHEADVKLAEHKGPMSEVFSKFSDSLGRWGGAYSEQLNAELGKMHADGKSFNFSMGDGNGGGFNIAMGGNGRMGMSLQQLSPQLAKYFGLNDRTGALVGSVREKSPAADAGLQAGDVVTEIDGKKVTSPMDVPRALEGKGEGDVSVTVLRDKTQRTFTVHLKAPEKNGIGMGMDQLNQLFEGSDSFAAPPDGPFQMFMQFPDGSTSVEGGSEEEIEMAPKDNGSDNNGAIGNPHLGGLLPPDAPNANAPHARVRTRIMRAPMPPMPNQPMLTPPADDRRIDI